MASLYKRGNAWAIQYDDREKNRRTLGIGAIAAATARKIHTHVENLIAAKALHVAPPMETVAWVRAINDALHAKLADHELVEPRHRTTIKAFGDRYERTRVDWSTGTRQQFGLALADAVRFWGADRTMDSVSAADADALRADLAARLKLATVRKRLRILKHLFRQAMRASLIVQNPLADQKTTSGANRERMRYVSVDNAMAVANELTGELRLIFLLARFAGMRVPSEPNKLRLDQVDFDNEVLHVYSQKTSTTRTVPMLPVVKSALLSAFSGMPDGAEYVLKQRRKLPVIRRAIERAAIRANVPIWPRVLQQLRSSFATDCVRVLPANAAAAVLGHSRQVAAEHYWMVDATDIQRAANALRNLTETPENTPKPQPAKNAQVLNTTEPCGNNRNVQVGQTGFEPALEGF